MVSIPIFFLSIFCSIITTSPTPGSTINGMVNRSGPHGILTVMWSGHDCVSISHCWPDHGTTRACPTNACINAVFIIHGCPRRASTSSADIAVTPKPESMNTLTSAAAEAPGTVRRAICCESSSRCNSVSTVSTLVSPHPPVCKSKTRAYEMVLESPRHCSDAGAGSYTGTK